MKKTIFLFSNNMYNMQPVLYVRNFSSTICLKCSAFTALFLAHYPHQCYVFSIVSSCPGWVTSDQPSVGLKPSFIALWHKWGESSCTDPVYPYVSYIFFCQTTFCSGLREVVVWL